MCLRDGRQTRGQHVPHCVLGHRQCGEKLVDRFEEKGKGELSTDSTSQSPTRASTAEPAIKESTAAPCQGLNHAEHSGSNT